MSTQEVTFRKILAQNDICAQEEILVINKETVFFIEINRIIQCLTVLSRKQQEIILRKMVKCVSKSKTLNLLHDLAIPMTSIKV